MQLVIIAEFDAVIADEKNVHTMGEIAFES